MGSECMDNEESVPPAEPPKIGIICNLRHPGKTDVQTLREEAEFDTPETVEAICRALRRMGAETVVLEADKNLAAAVTASGITMAFNIAEGRAGRAREAQVPALLDLLGVPYTGSDAVALGVALDKVLCKRLVAACGVRTADYALVTRPGQLPAHLHYPVIVKPNAEGSGKGISEHCIAVDETELAQLLARDLPANPAGLLVEEYLPGREFTVGILGNGATRQILSPMEILYNQNTQRDFKVYSYAVKCNYTEHVRYECPARLSEAQNRALTEAAGAAFDALGCQDVARADFRMDAAGQPCFLEINPLPGLAPGYSDLPMIAQADGIAYDELVCDIYKAARQRMEAAAQ